MGCQVLACWLVSKWSSCASVLHEQQREPRCRLTATDKLRGLHAWRLGRTHVMAGPTCGQLLADMGADVVKVERLEIGGDGIRRTAPYVRWHRPSHSQASDLLATRSTTAALAALATLPYLTLPDCADAGLCPVRTYRRHSS